jgi:septum formation protein
MTSPKGASPIASAEFHLVLASESPRRLRLLAQAGIVPAEVMAPAIDEAPRKDELPRLHAERLAKEKALACAARLNQPAFILAADTVVACGRRILPKAQNEDEVRACFALLSGRSHQVITAIALITPEGKLREKTALTRVTFFRLDAKGLDAYVASGEGIGKAGGYAIQGLAEIFVKQIQGSYSNVVGLPLALTVALLKGEGYRC